MFAYNNLRMSDLIKEAFQQIYPEKELKYSISLKYSKKFKHYNANVKLHNNNLTFNLSKEWKSISKEIQIGLIQELFIRILKNKKNQKTTINIDLYNLFIKNLHLAIPKTEKDEILEQSFNRVNEIYFNGMLDKPNLRWNDSRNRLGSYEYCSDTITISNTLRSSKQEFLDYVMYHEMLHKKLKFKSTNSRKMHHSKEFREMEAKFEKRESIEKGIRNRMY